MSTFTACATSGSMAETQQLAACLAERLGPGDVVCLYGHLGAGKTCFTKGLVAGLGGAADDVTSPTFVLMQVYEARLPVYHFDAYRLSSGRDLVDIGSDEILCDDGVSAVEWADRVADALPPERIDVHLEVAGESERRIRVTGLGPRQADCVAGLAEDGILSACGG